MAEDKAQQLMAFLAGLPETLALRLAKAVEVDRLSEGTQLPHDLILSGLRPVLRRALRVDRTLTAKRLFCRPFNDILSSAPRKEKQRGRIARSSVEPVWNWLLTTLLPGQAENYRYLVRQAVLAYEPRDAEVAAATFRAAAARAMSQALADETGRKSARLALGGDLVLADADEMAILLSIAPQVAEIQTIVARPTPSLSEEILWRLRTICDGLEVSRPDAVPYIAIITMNRLERPWEALRLPLMVARQSHDVLVSSTDMGLVGELLLLDLDGHAIAIRNTRPPHFDAGELIDHITGFVLLSSGLVKEIELRRDGKWGQHLMKDRAAVAEIMDDMMKRAPREIFAAIPMQKSGAYAGGPRVPDLTKPLDADKRERALNNARLIAGCKTLASAGSFGASLGTANAEVCAMLKAYSEEILRELRAAEGEQRERVDQYFELVVALTEILLSSEEAEFLRRRGRAAAAPQVAA